ncbi:MAG: F-type H+-transporting ATPase subunit epsilon [Frankiaceae bacterium]|nr:F-type H+-transporting ATPase subunit epsilon [Frankiaceae bacterium]
MADMYVELVAVERQLWAGQALQVSARTLDGDIGVLPGHAPILGVLADGGVVRIKRAEGDELVAAVHGGFVSVSSDVVRVLAESAELSEEIDVARAKAALDRTAQADPDDEDAVAARSRAEARLRAVGQLA